MNHVSNFISVATKTYHAFIHNVAEKPRGLDFIRMNNSQYESNNSTFPYSTVSQKMIKQIFSNVNISPQDTILDIGCGKGYALYIFGKLGFKRIYGIELMPELCKIAQNNITSLNLHSKITVECIDATKYNTLDEYNYIYMFNPFSLEIMKSVVYNIEQSLARKARNLNIIYVNPTCHDVFLKSSFLKLESQRIVSGRIRKGFVNYYRSK